MDVTPVDITLSFFTTTVPTDGFKPVFLSFFLLIDTQDLKNNYDFFHPLPINCSKSLPP